jgi:hypothetical protein
MAVGENGNVHLFEPTESHMRRLSARRLVDNTDATFSVNGKFFASGDTTIDGDFDVNSNIELNTDGTSSFSGLITADSLSVTNDASVGGNAAVTGTLGVTGASTLGVLTAGASTLGASTLASASVTGDASVGGNAAVTGTLTATGAITANGGVTARGLINIDGADADGNNVNAISIGSTHAGVTTGTQAINMNGLVDVKGKFQVSGTLLPFSNMEVQNDLRITGATAGDQVLVSDIPSLFSKALYHPVVINKHTDPTAGASPLDLDLVWTDKVGTDRTSAGEDLNDFVTNEARRRAQVVNIGYLEDHGRDELVFALKVLYNTFNLDLDDVLAKYATAADGVNADGIHDGGDADVGAISKLSFATANVALYDSTCTDQADQTACDAKGAACNWDTTECKNNFAVAS